VSKNDSTAEEVSLAGWRSPSPAGVLAQLAWDVHRESTESYLQMSNSLLAGSSATSLPTPADGSPDPLLESFTLPQLAAAHFPQGITEDLLRKARQPFPLAFPKLDPLVRTPIVGERGSQSCFTARLKFTFRREDVSNLQAALGSKMYDLLGLVIVDDKEQELEKGYYEEDYYEYNEDEDEVLDSDKDIYGGWGFGFEAQTFPY
jgi:hypothetical protein